MKSLGKIELIAKFETNDRGETHLKIGKVSIGKYYYDGFREKDSPLAYKVVSLIPSIKTNLGSYKTREECENLLLKAAKVFFNQLKYVK